jgi:hypothetical protein
MRLVGYERLSGVADSVACFLFAQLVSKLSRALVGDFGRQAPQCIITSSMLWHFFIPHHGTILTEPESATCFAQS